MFWNPQPVGLEAAHLRFHPLRQALGEGAVRAALEDHDVVAGRALGGLDHVEGNAAHGRDAELLERQGLIEGAGRRVDALAGIGGERRLQVDRAELQRIGATDVSKDVAKRFATERLETFRHERAAGVDAALDIALLDLLGAGKALEHQAGRILTGENAGMEGAILGFNVPCHEAGIDLAVRIDNGGEQLGGAVRTHAGQPGANIGTDIVELMAGGAGGHEERLAFDHIARLLNDRRKLRKHLILRLHRRTKELVQRGIRTAGDVLVGMRPQPCQIGWPDPGNVDFLRFDPLDQRQRPIGTLQQHFKRSRLGFGRKLAECAGERAAHGRIAGFAKRDDEVALEGGRRIAGGRLDDGRKRVRVGAAKPDEALGGGEARIIRGRARVEFGE